MTFLETLIAERDQCYRTLEHLEGLITHYEKLTNVKMDTLVSETPATTPTPQVHHTPVPPTPAPVTLAPVSPTPVSPTPPEEQKLFGFQGAPPVPPHTGKGKPGKRQYGSTKERIAIITAVLATSHEPIPVQKIVDFIEEMNLLPGTDNIRKRIDRALQEGCTQELFKNTSRGMYTLTQRGRNYAPNIAGSNGVHR